MLTKHVVLKDTLGNTRFATNVPASAPSPVGVAVRQAANQGVCLFALDLSNTDLSDADLSALDLSYSDFRKSALARANLTGTNLTWAYLGMARLAGAVISRATLSHAVLMLADFTGADLSSTNLSEIRMDFDRLMAGCVGARGRQSLHFLLQALDEGKIERTIAEFIPNGLGYVGSATKRWFEAIGPRDTPSTNQFAAIAAAWIGDYLSRHSDSLS